MHLIFSSDVNDLKTTVQQVVIQITVQKRMMFKILYNFVSSDLPYRLMIQNIIKFHVSAQPLHIHICLDK